MTRPPRCQATDNGHPCHLDANHYGLHAWSDAWGLTRWDDDGNHIHHQWTEAVVSQHPSTDPRPCSLCGEPLQSAQPGARYCGEECRAIGKQAVRLRQMEKRQRVGRRLTDEERALRAITERTLQLFTSRMLISVGFRAAHHFDSRFSDPGTKGMPDLIVLGHGQYFQIELKRWNGVLSADQETWRDQSAEAGIEYLVFRPQDWGELVALARTRSRRPVPEEFHQLPHPKRRKV